MAWWHHSWLWPLTLMQFVKANSAFHPLRVGKWVPASAGKAKAGLVYSISRWMRGVQVKLSDPLRMCAIPECLRGVFRTRYYINPHLPIPLPLCDVALPFVADCMCSETSRTSRCWCVVVTAQSAGRSHASTTSVKTPSVSPHRWPLYRSAPVRLWFAPQRVALCICDRSKSKPG